MKLLNSRTLTILIVFKLPSNLSHLSPQLALGLAGLYSASWTLGFTALFWNFAPKNSANANPPALAQLPRNPNLELNPAFQNRAYLLGPGDQISVQVQRFPEYNFAGPISQEGVIVLPLVGGISLRNLTVQQAQQLVRDRLNRYVRNPIVSLSLLVQRPVQVTVTGEVARPGFYPLSAPQISFAIAAAGGTTTTAELRAVQVRRPLADGSVAQQTIDLLTPLQTGQTPPDVRLEDGDAIIVPYQQVTPERKSERDLAARYSLAAPQGPVQVTVTGEVAKPGFYNLPAGAGRISAAIVAAGGTTQNADLRDVRVRRTLVDGSVAEEPIDLYTPLVNATDLYDLPLQNGDAVIVPQLEPGNEDVYNRALIAKSTLIKPRIFVRVLSYAGGGLASFYLDNGSTFLDALTGVPLDTADLRHIALVRFDPETGQAVSRKLDAKAALRGDASQNPMLEDNDVIVVGRNFIARMSYALNTATQPFRDILGFLLFFQQLRLGAENLFSPSPRR